MSLPWSAAKTMGVANVEIENGVVYLAGKNDSDWKLFPTDPSEEVQQEPWLKAAMDTLNRELMRQGTRIQGQFSERNCLLCIGWNEVCITDEVCG